MFKKSQSTPFHIFRHYATYRKLQKKSKKNRIFFSVFSFLRAFVVSSCRKSGFRFRVFLSLRYGADLGRSRLVCNLLSIMIANWEVHFLKACLKQYSQVLFKKLKWFPFFSADVCRCVERAAKFATKEARCSCRMTRSIPSS